VHFIGLDLAWGERSPTGVAVLDDDGALVLLMACRTDDEIAEALARYTSDGCLVAIDAPLIVKNATGNRQAEADLNRDFARFDAGAHPVNTSKPEIGDTPRAAVLSERLGLQINPDVTSARRAIEVYPHPATVALFRLGRTLKYKNKKGRDLETLRSELLLLMKRVQGLSTADPALFVGTPGSRWPALLKAVHAATRKNELRVVEDQVDAVICAYVALFATREPGQTRMYGDAATGYIITPALPDGLSPSPRSSRLGPDAARDSIQVAVQQYSAQFPAIEANGDQFVKLVQSILDDAGINYLSVTGRIKSVTSFAAKAARRIDGKLLYPEPLQDITDQIGIRVITYALSDVAAVADLMHDQVLVLDDRDMGRETASQGRFGYASRHLLIAPGPGQPEDPDQRLTGRTASLQIRTVLQHAWAEFEHDIRYKGVVPDEHASEFDRRFTLAAGLLELADREFSAIRDRLRIEHSDQASQDDADRTKVQDDDPRIDPRELAAFLAGQYPDAGWSRTDHYAWISGLLLELGITSFSELSDILRPVNDLDLSGRMDYRYPPGAVRRLDDALLRAFGAKYLELHGNAHRVQALRARLERLLDQER
jgi:predicted RNase H-like nuclease/ppGpp synthetase/RelA/SpoT-type nucleotidyltranferase